MKNISILLLLSGLFLSSCEGGKSVVFSDNFNSPERSVALWDSDESDDGLFEIAFLPDSGVDGGGCVMITNTEKASSVISHKLTGLNPDKLYRITANLRCDSVRDGRGAVLFLEPDDDMSQPWNASEFVYGTCDWREVYMDFLPDSRGEAVICCGLGFPWGTYNGGKAAGTVWYDNVKVTETPPDKIYSMESEHIMLYLDPEKVTITDAQMQYWLSVLDRTYLAYEDLVGGVPYEGRKIAILNTPGIEPGYWALAGNPILWNSNVAVSKLLERTVEYDDWGFGILHEIGHVFNIGNTRWDWNDEIFANYRMSYALEAEAGTMSQRDVCYKGADGINYYKISYDETIGAGIPKNNGDALHYTFMRIKEKYGWDVYKQAFRELSSLSKEDTENLKGSWNKFLFFLSYVSKAAGENVLETTYTAEELKLIEESLKN